MVGLNSAQSFHRVNEHREEVFFPSSEAGEAVSAVQDHNFPNVSGKMYISLKSWFLPENKLGGGNTENSTGTRAGCFQILFCLSRLLRNTSENKII